MPNEYRGEVEVELAGNTYTLRPTMNAIAMLESKGGSVRKLLANFVTTDEHGNTVENPEWSITDVVNILRAGFAGQGGDAPKPGEIGDLVMKEGAYNLVPPCIEFLSNCLNGGKAVQAETSDADDAEDPTKGADT